MFYKTSLDDSKFHVLDLSPKRGRPKIYGNIKLLLLYTTTRPVTEEKHKDIIEREREREREKARARQSAGETKRKRESAKETNREKGRERERGREGT
ncbi:hypothetical protein ANTQUA_LOCUS4242 [Anthophora quadrimaculata]